MKYITLATVFLTTTISFANPVVVDVAYEKRHFAACQSSPNAYTRDACNQIRRAENKRNDSSDEVTILNETTESSGNHGSDQPLPAWQKALQPPTTSEAPQ